MKDTLLFVLAITVDFSVSYLLGLIFEFLFVPVSPTVRGSARTVAAFMTIFSLLTVFVPGKAFLATPGVFVGMVTVLILSQYTQIDGLQYFWVPVAAVVNFFTYYALLLIAAKYFRSLFAASRGPVPKSPG